MGGICWRLRGGLLLLGIFSSLPWLVSCFQTSFGRRRLVSSIAMALPGGQQSFNPFSSRNRNKNIQWFEADLETFYRFVEQQPLLTNEQEIKYGRALRMWQKVEERWREDQCQGRNRRCEGPGSGQSDQIHGAQWLA